MKSDMDYFYNSDQDLQTLQSQIEYWKTMIDTLSEIVSNITWRHQTISNMIKWRQFTSGG
jgi:prefoldin subunit 5